MSSHIKPNIPTFSEKFNTSQTNINDLSDEILLHIFSTLNLEFLANASLTCKHWKVLSFDRHLIKSLFFRLIPQAAELYKNKSPEVQDNEYFLQILKIDVRIRSSKIQPPGLVLLQSITKIGCLQVADGKIFSGSHDKTIRMWDIVSGKKLKVLIGHTDRVTCLQVVNGKVFSGSWDKTIRVWDIDSGKEIRVIDNERSVKNLFVEEGKIFVQSINKEIRLFDFNLDTIPVNKSRFSLSKLSHYFLILKVLHELKY